MGKSSIDNISKSSTFIKEEAEADHSNNVNPNVGVNLNNNNNNNIKSDNTKVNGNIRTKSIDELKLQGRTIRNLDKFNDDLKPSKLHIAFDALVILSILYFLVIVLPSKRKKT